MIAITDADIEVAEGRIEGLPWWRRACFTLGLWLALFAITPLRDDQP